MDTFKLIEFKTKPVLVFLNNFFFLSKVIEHKWLGITCKLFSLNLNSI